MTTIISGDYVNSPALEGVTSVQVGGLNIQDVPAQTKATAYTLALSDRGTSIDTSAGITVPTNAVVAFPIGTVITLTNTTSSSITISQASGVTLRFAGSTLTGNRTLIAYGMVTLRKVAVDTWFIAGAGLT
jgi:hypothetical protein